MSTYYVYCTDDASGTPSYSTTDIEADATERGNWAAWRVETPHASGYKALAYVLRHAAGLWLPTGITVTRLIPREPTVAEKLEDARRIMRADYWDDVRSVAEDVKEEIENGNLTDRDAVTEYLDERVDSASRVIWTQQAMEAVIYSDNDGAYEEHFGSDGMVEDGCIMWSRLAFFAMQADVMDQLGDVDELLAEAQTECGLCGVAFTEEDETEIYVDHRGNKRKDHVECPEDEDEDTGAIADVSVSLAEMVEAEDEED